MLPGTVVSKWKSQRETEFEYLEYCIMYSKCRVSDSAWCSAITLYDVVVWHPHSQQDKAVVPEDRLGLIFLPHGTSTEHHFLLNCLRSVHVKRKKKMDVEDEGRQMTKTRLIMMMTTMR